MLNVVRAWILLSTLLVAAGWILSAFHALNRAGYGIVFLLAAAAFLWRGRTQWPLRDRLARGLHKLAQRFKRPAPLLFLILVTMSLLSGILYAPYNSDTYAYRFPRVLHWLGREQWHWIHTADVRMNVAGCGYEWLASPLMLFTGTDRCLFLINWVSYLMLPGLIFCAFRQMGMRPRVAWWWCWLLSAGWCYVLQSASVANDALAVIYALAAVVLALKTRETGEPTDFWLSLLAAALLTGLKQTDIPLAALWLFAAWPGRRVTLTAPAISLAMVTLGLLVSGVPMAIFDFRHTGTWSGISAFQSQYPDWHVRLDSPFWGIVGNAFYIPVLQLLPPFFPWSGAWNHAMSVFLTTPFGAHFKSFEKFGAVDPGVTESSAGIGLAIIILTAISICAARKFPTASGIKCSRLQAALRLCPWFLLIIFMANVGLVQNSRYLAGYYVFFFPSLLGRDGQETLVRRRWWQDLALLCMASSILLLMVNPARPLFPAVTITRQLADHQPQSKIIPLLQGAYSVSRSFKIAERQIQKMIPPNEPLVGYAAVGNARFEPALWLPLGVRRVERVVETDSPAQLASQGIRYVVIEDYPSLDCSIADWMARYHASLVTELTVQQRGHDNVQSHVYLMRLNRQ